ncbi:CbrC family protein [Enterococcus sp. BWM-S5]|uniref:CbrC family protein n=1 Tax=Enterococcus larvae TaxID=2794352 RepID=A0ABS4CM22_9ENTE|nr:CbrC family protein [Enterococcus larvae]MBP1047554.1 CbrC family protein [Enterococcus larvae]
MPKQNYPTFKYSPNLDEIGILETSSNTCECCGETVTKSISHMYSTEEIECVCLTCVANGKAAETFDGEFIQDAEVDQVTSQERVNELFKHTPGYVSWQGEYWLAHCDDFCAYLGEVGTKELEELGIADQVIAEYEALGHYQGIRSYLTKSGSMCGYLFQCLHCGKYRLWVDCD